MRAASLLIIWILCFSPNSKAMDTGRSWSFCQEYDCKEVIRSVTSFALVYGVSFALILPYAARAKFYLAPLAIATGAYIGREYYYVLYMVLRHGLNIP